MHTGIVFFAHEYILIIDRGDEELVPLNVRKRNPGTVKEMPYAVCAPERQIIWLSSYGKASLTFQPMHYHASPLPFRSPLPGISTGLVPRRSASIAAPIVEQNTQP
jgi:hypothetical protein